MTSENPVESPKFGKAERSSLVSYLRKALRSVFIRKSKFGMAAGR
jgi:hypothetical protein